MSSDGYGFSTNGTSHILYPAKNTCNEVHYVGSTTIPVLSDRILHIGTGGHKPFGYFYVIAANTSSMCTSVALQISKPSRTDRGRTVRVPEYRTRCFLE